MAIGEKTSKLVMTAMMMCLIIVATMFFKIPIPFANGYVHLGDAMVFLSVLVLGIKHGVFASAAGSALGDVLGGFAIWAPWTLVIKGVMALIMGLLVKAATKEPTNGTIPRVTAAQAVGMCIAGLWMTAGYYAAEGVIYGNWAVALLGIPWNVGQFATGAALAVGLSASLCKTPARRYFVRRW
ncbi:MAG: ECF transporter S component [Clostridiales bacterium]|nr:ECF transporter S component [Clostridiales bacterium]